MSQLMNRRVRTDTMGVRTKLQAMHDPHVRLETRPKLVECEGCGDRAVRVIHGKRLCGNCEEW